MLLGFPFFADGDGILATPNPTIINSDETRNSSQSLNLPGSFPTEDSPLYMIGTSNGVLNNNHAMDDLTTMSRRYGVFPFIKKHRHMCFYNHKLSHLLGQRLTGPLPHINDPTDMDRITDVQMTLAPKKNITLVLDIDGKSIYIFFLLISFLALEVYDMLIFCLHRNPHPLIDEKRGRGLLISSVKWRKRVHCICEEETICGCLP